MLLEKITCPEDLRSLTEPELEVLAQEIRDFIVGAVARTHQVFEILERESSGPAVLVGSDVGRRHRPELAAATEELRGVDHFGLALEGVAARREAGIRVAVVAGAAGVDDVAAQTHEDRILAAKIQRDGADSEARRHAVVAMSRPIGATTGGGVVPGVGSGSDERGGGGNQE